MRTSSAIVSVIDFELSLDYVVIVELRSLVQDTFGISLGLICIFLVYVPIRSVGPLQSSDHPAVNLLRRHLSFSLGRHGRPSLTGLFAESLVFWQRAFCVVDSVADYYNPLSLHRQVYCSGKTTGETIVQQMVFFPTKQKVRIFVAQTHNHHLIWGEHAENATPFLHFISANCFRHAVNNSATEL